MVDSTARGSGLQVEAGCCALLEARRGMGRWCRGEGIHGRSGVFAWTWGVGGALPWLGRWRRPTMVLGEDMQRWRQGEKEEKNKIRF